LFKGRPALDSSRTIARLQAKIHAFQGHHQGLCVFANHPAGEGQTLVVLRASACNAAASSRAPRPTAMAIPKEAADLLLRASKVRGSDSRICGVYYKFVLGKKQV